MGKPLAMAINLTSHDALSGEPILDPDAPCTLGVKHPYTMRLASGTYLDVFNPAPEHLARVTWPDVVQGLRGQIRWRNQLRRPVSVLRHSFVVMTAVDALLRSQGAPASTREAVMQAAALHDASEAFLGDTPTPHKRHVAYAGVSRVDNDLQRGLNTRFGVYADGHEGAAVKEADRFAMIVEARTYGGFDPVTTWGASDAGWLCASLLGADGLLGGCAVSGVIRHAYEADEGDVVADFNTMARAWGWL